MNDDLDVGPPTQPPRLLEDKVALVTGASSGLGQRFAVVLCAAGCRVVVTARRADRLAQLCDSAGGRATFLDGDLTNPDHRQALVDLVEERYGRLDILVNNAGRSDDGPLEGQTLEELTSVIDLNLVATLDLCRLAARLLFLADRPSVINVASMYGIVASRGPMAAYNASKGAVVNLTRNLAAQWGDRGVRVNALAPGFFPTEMTGGLTDPVWAATIAQRTLLGRIPTIDELDGPLLFLASAASSYVTGHILTVDGGWTAV
jgi:NAD(P)-dependent dehydrogenase (short-subunit alcohol dehydrogenase family)